MNQNSFFIKSIIFSLAAHGALLGGFAYEYKQPRIEFFNDISAVKISTLRVLPVKMNEIEVKEQAEEKVVVDKAKEVFKKNKLEGLKPKKVVKQTSKIKSQEALGLGENKVHKVSIIHAPKPPFPFRARKLGFEGEVELEIDINSVGFVSKARIVKSSGRQDCDFAAKSTVLNKWRFSPATLNGKPVNSKEQVVIRFQFN